MKFSGGGAGHYPHRISSITEALRYSRRLCGLPPEGLTSTVPPDMTRTATQTGFQQLAYPVIARNARVFNGDGSDDVDDWIAQYERVCRANFWSDELQLANAYFFIEGPARTWFENHEPELSSWDAFKTGIKKAFAAHYRQERAEELLRTRIQLPNETVTSYTEDILRLVRRVDPAMPEHKRVKHLLHGVKEDIFRSLARDIPETADAFLSEALKIEKAMCSRNRPHSACLQTSPCDDQSLRSIIRQIVREEIERMLLPSNVHPPPPALATMIREEVQAAVLASPANAGVGCHPPSPSYASALRQASVASPSGWQDYRSSEMPARYDRNTDYRSPEIPARYDRNSADRPAPRKTDVWRTPDRRPLCYHCGEANHIYRGCPYRRIGLPGFSPNAPRPRPGDLPPAIAEYMRRDNTSAEPIPPRPRSSSPYPPNSMSRRQSRSPSPRRPREN